MSLVLNDEQLMLQDAASESLSERASIKHFRSLRSQTPCFDPDSWRHMIELGWPSILAPESLGGLGFGIGGLAVIAIEAGKNLSASPLFSSSGLSMTALLQCDASEKRDALIQDIAMGQKKVTLAMSQQGKFGLDTIGCVADQTLDQFNLNGSKKFVAEGSYSDILLVLATLDGCRQFFVVDANEEGLEYSQLTLMDRRDYCNITLKNVRVNQLAKLTWQDDENSALNNIVNTGSLLTSAELFGIAVEAFERTRVYLCDREQFGQKIGSFQGLQHRMAHAYSQLELLKSVLYDAIDSIETNRKDANAAVSHCKTLANQVSRLVTQEAIQMHGGIGVTDELDIGLFYKRARVLQEMLGDSQYHKNRFAQECGY